MINLLILFVLNFYFDGRVSNVTEHEFSVVYLEKCKVYTIRSPQVAEISMLEIQSEFTLLILNLIKWKSLKGFGNNNHNNKK